MGPEKGAYREIIINNGEIWQTRFRKIFTGQTTDSIVRKAKIPVNVIY